MCSSDLQGSRDESGSQEEKEGQEGGGRRCCRSCRREEGRWWRRCRQAEEVTRQTRTKAPTLRCQRRFDLASCDLPPEHGRVNPASRSSPADSHHDRWRRNAARKLDVRRIRFFLRPVPRRSLASMTDRRSCGPSTAAQGLEQRSGLLKLPCFRAATMLPCRSSPRFGLD